MKLSLPVLCVALPFVSALILALVPSWRIGTRVNAAASSLLFLLSCLLLWYPREPTSLLRAGTPEVHLTLLTAFVAMTTSWMSVRYVSAALARRSIDRVRARVYHVAYQAFVGAMVCALLSDNPALTWIMLVVSIAAGAVLIGLPGSVTAPAAAWRMLQHCAVGLMLMLFGLLALTLAAGPNAAALHWSTIAASASHFHAAALDLSVIFLVLGCATLAGLAPMHSWLVDAAAEGAAPGAILLSTLAVNVPLLVILRVRDAVAVNAGVTVLLLALGLASLLLAACCQASRLDSRRLVASSGLAQIGIVGFAFGLGTQAAIFAGMLIMTMLSLTRASVLQCLDLEPSRASQRTCAVAVAVLLTLPLFALFLIAGATIDRASWLMLPLGGGVILTFWTLVARLPVLALPAAARDRGGSGVEMLALAPIWVQLAITVLLAVAMPGPVVEWFHALARAN